MQEILLVVHLMLALAIVVLVLLQRSEGGALGIGGGGGGNFMTGREAANLLTRMTAIAAAAFMATSILLSIMSRPEGAASIADKVEQNGGVQTNQPADPSKPVVPVGD